MKFTVEIKEDNKLTKYDFNTDPITTDVKNAFFGLKKSIENYMGKCVKKESYIKTEEKDSK